MKKLTYLLVIVTSILFLGLIFSYEPLKADTKDESDKEDKLSLNILAVNKKIYSLVKDLVGDKHNLSYLVNSEKEIINLDLDEVSEEFMQTNLFIYNGFVEDNLLKNIINKFDVTKTGLINISRGVRPILSNSYLEDKKNPYYLLGFNEYKIALYNVKEALQDKDFENRNYYEENYNKIVKEIDDFLIEAKNELDKYKYKDYSIITNTNKFDYLFRSLDIETKSIDDIESLEYTSDGKFIFIYSKEDDNIEEIKNHIDISFNYLGLSSEGDYKCLLENTKLIIEAIKNNING